jgi:hypothetical protein
VHLVKASSSMLTSRQAAPGDMGYKPIWASNEDFGEIKITSTLLSDHSPATVCQELERIAEAFGLQPPYFLPLEE